ncbi:hypothetical protein JCM6882_001850 [Rhodosporidiobolus microsporus]
MFASRSLTAFRRLPSTARGYATAAGPKPYTPPQYTVKERLQRFVPTEAFPLLAFWVIMPTFGIVTFIFARNRVPGELRLSRSTNQAEETKPWEDPKALAGKW